MDDVYLEGATPDGPAVVGHLSVIVDTAGITFLGPDPGERRTVGWDRTSPLEFGQPAAMPDGEQVTALEFVVDGRPLRLLVPSQRTAPGDDGVTEVVPVDPTSVTPASVLVEMPPSAETPVVIELPVRIEPPALIEPPVAIEPPAPVLSAPPASGLLDGPPAPHLAEPPAPVFAAPPPATPEVVAAPAPVVGLDDTFVGTTSADAPADEEWEGDDDLDRPRATTWFRYAPRQPRPTHKHLSTSAPRTWPDWPSSPSWPG